MKFKMNLGVILDLILFSYFLFYVSLFTVTDYSSLHHKGSISNILGPTLGLGVLFFIRWTVDRKDFKDSLLFAFFLRLKKTNDKNLLLFLCGYTFVFFSLVSIFRHLSLFSGAFDLGTFDQATWNVIHGNSSFCTIKYPHGGTLLGDHLETIMFLIAPLYWVWTNVIILLLLQSFLLASSLIPLYLIAKMVLKNRSLIFAFLICFILSKPLRAIGISDFYTESFIIPALFWAYYFLIKRNNLLLALSVIVLLLCKEDSTFLVLGLGLFAIFNQKRNSLGLSFIISALFLWWLQTSVIIPYFSPTHKYDYLNKLPFANTYVENMEFCFFHPILFLQYIFSAPKIEYILRLFGPLGFLSILSPPHFILFAIPLFKNLLASQNNNIFYTINSHYIAGILPFIFISAIYGCDFLLVKLNITKGVYWVGLGLIIFTLFFYGKTDGYRFAQFIRNMQRQHTLEQVRRLDMIPADASVIATNSLCPHLSHRKYIYQWDPKGEQTIFPEYIAIDKFVTGDEYLKPHDLQLMNAYLNAAMNRGYKVIYSEGNGDYLILKDFSSRATNS